MERDAWSMNMAQEYGMISNFKKNNQLTRINCVDFGSCIIYRFLTHVPALGRIATSLKHV